MFYKLGLYADSLKVAGAQLEWQSDGMLGPDSIVTWERNVLDF